MKASPSLKYDQGSKSFRSSASSSASFPDQRDCIAPKNRSDGTSSPSNNYSESPEAGGMFQLDSLTAAATAVESRSSESNFYLFSIYIYILQKWHCHDLLKLPLPIHQLVIQ